MSKYSVRTCFTSRYIPVMFLLFFFLPILADAQPDQRYTYSSRHMGTTFRIVLYSSSEALADSASDAAFQRVEQLNAILSDYDPESELNKLSRTAGKDTAVIVSDPLFHVLKKAQQVSRQTNGAFDVTVGPYVKLWRAMNRQAQPELPSETKLDSTAMRVGYQHLILDVKKQSVTLVRRGMQLDLGGIAKGFAVDEALKILHDHGITSALVDGGGDIALGNSPPGRNGWHIEVLTHDRSGVKERLMLELSNKAVATSGDLYQHVEINGNRYSHIIDPRTGLGLTSRRQVTIIARNGITADSYASAASVLKPEVAISLIEQLPGVELFIEQNSTGEIKRWETNGFKTLLDDQ